MQYEIRCVVSGSVCDSVHNNPCIVVVRDFKFYVLIEG